MDRYRNRFTCADAVLRLRSSERIGIKLYSDTKGYRRLISSNSLKAGGKVRSRDCANT